MTRKTYRTYELKGYSVHITIDGKYTQVSFKRGCTLGSTATYTTSDPKIQEALESLRAYKETFFLEKEEKIGEDTPNVVAPVVEPEPAKEEEKEVVDMLDAQTFKNLVELRNALTDKGIDVSSITNVKAAEALAKKNGYNYTVDKNA